MFQSTAGGAGKEQMGYAWWVGLGEGSRQWQWQCSVGAVAAVNDAFKWVPSFVSEHSP